MLRVNALVKNNNQIIRGDTLYYEKQTGYGEGFSNIELFDEEQNIILRGTGLHKPAGRPCPADRQCPFHLYYQR